MTDNTKFQEFVTNRIARSQITFGDIRRLQRDYLPDGVTTTAEAEMLIRLDGAVERADRAWADWLAAAIVDFLTSGEQPEDGREPREWLKRLLAELGASTKATRKIARELRAERARQPIAFLAIDDSAVAMFPTVIEPATNQLEMAA